MLSFHADQGSQFFDYRKPILLLGSCFSNEMAEKFTYSGFQVATNPLGTFFHPMPIARFLSYICSENQLPDEHLIDKKSVFSSWESSTSMQFPSSIEVEQYFEQVKAEWDKWLKSASHLFITFGTAWGYEREGYGIVANCHKFPSSDFVKRLVTADEIQQSFDAVLKKLNARYPQLSIIFTVSPVRHIRDGIIENNRSKSELIRSVHELVHQNDCALYFPSYELVIDVLRDYRFYKRDLVHPSEEAIDYVWEEVLLAFTTKETQLIVNEVVNYRKMEQHRPMNHDQTSINTWNKKVEEERLRLESKISGLRLK